ncbi:YraN family protein [Rhodopirellula sp. MGV]|uniref:YraN family protein n=1 Tax=Rhodopirellula sp. MGV TaxID=2023130 RepID=UPI000B97BC01|nr:YraN family protein [Rhodopirellula sp. MGV]OYP35754.1 YraN family protein [Rhodopirellula sp. MGV]PNY33662.1 YraN family protein [Rhodopirellula baltica]
MSLLSSIRRWPPLNQWAERLDQWRFGTVDSTGPIGLRGEQAAARLLRKKGLVIVAANESDRAGEIDLIAADRKSRSIIFVEVKTLQTTKPGHPAERVDENKQRRITQAALRFLKRRRLLGTRCRFDVVAIWWPNPEGQPDRIDHYEAAFEAIGDHQLWA